ncbi:iron complex outermembrane receptor protein [Pedobacter sp. CAN_A7]|uniref:TonB-dependent receptor n=1 Tax=Pedobacter sp. CAN_A7 TaxID=2787722 RepID=UPI0018C8F141
MLKGLLTVIGFPLAICPGLSLAQDTLRLQEVQVHGQHSPVKRNSISTTISAKQLLTTKGGNLADALVDVPGVSTLKSGGTIAKPVIHGLHSNRILLLNNEVRLEGQQWGAEHAPEIDPFIAERIHVVKGAETIRYGAEALGGVIMVEPPALPKTADFGGMFNLVGASNGRAGATSLMLNGGLKALPGFGWRIQQSLRKAGNIKTADYYLGNTGLRENNFSVALGYTRKKSQYEAFYSKFNTDLGVLYSAHVGSMEDIEARIALGRPTEQYAFDYGISAPKQRVNHQLLKLKVHYDFSENQQLDLVYAFQNNHRREYDFRRGDREAIPITDLVLRTHTVDGQLTSYTKNGHKRNYGFNAVVQVNNNIPGTLANTFIPNFDTYTTGAFVMQRWITGDFELEAGLRYDYKYFDAAGFRYSYNIEGPEETINEQYYGGENSFHNVTGSAGMRWNLRNNSQLISNIGLAWRAPTANELFSNGLHHGAGLYEVGDPELKSEQGYKWTTSFEHREDLYTIDAAVYTQYINNYIYSKPGLQYRQTISGTFPVFSYEQANAFFYGADIAGTYQLLPSLSYRLTASVVRARNLDDQTHLPYIPSNRMGQQLTWNFNPQNNKDHYLQFGHQQVARQSRYEQGSDYAAPPNGYTLFSLAAGSSINLGKQVLRMHLQADNLFNNSYKDYMNRYRYYAHEMGRNITIRLAYQFN